MKYNLNPLSISKLCKDNNLPYTIMVDSESNSETLSISDDFLSLEFHYNVCTKITSYALAGFIKPTKRWKLSYYTNVFTLTNGDSEINIGDIR